MASTLPRDAMLPSFVRSARAEPPAEWLETSKIVTARANVATPTTGASQLGRREATVADLSRGCSASSLCRKRCGPEPGVPDLPIGEALHHDQAERCGGQQKDRREGLSDEHFLDPLRIGRLDGGRPEQQPGPEHRRPPPVEERGHSVVLPAVATRAGLAGAPDVVEDLLRANQVEQGHEPGPYRPALAEAQAPGSQRREVPVEAPRPGDEEPVAHPSRRRTAAIDSTSRRWSDASRSAAVTDVGDDVSRPTSR